MEFDFTFEQRNEVWSHLIDHLNHYLKDTSKYDVAPELNGQSLRSWIEEDPLDKGVGIQQAVAKVLEGMTGHTVHTPHPSYYGLFNPRANFASILADTITATYNPQMAAWSHAPFAVEVEQLLIRQLGQKFGYTETDGVFASGGAEANQTALLCALNFYFPEYATLGIKGIQEKPLIYCSKEGHHSILKAARASGLGSDSIRTINVDNSLAIDVNALSTRIEKDIKAGFRPLMIVATFGTTGPGSVDPLAEIASIVDNFDMWMHVDAAYGGAVSLSAAHKHHLKGIERSHSITFDIHKWLSVPMGCSVFLTAKPQILSQTFRTTTEYMPKDASGLEVTDPFTHGIQWSRRFIGLKLYLSLLTFGWNGYEELIDKTIQIGDYLRERLLASSWKIHNDTFLPIVCFTAPEGSIDAMEICQNVIGSGKAWLSVYPIGETTTIRACITNYLTEKTHIDQLLRLLNRCIEK